MLSDSLSGPWHKEGGARILPLLWVTQSNRGAAETRGSAPREMAR